MYSSYNKLRKSFCDITPHRKKQCRLILSYITCKIVVLHLSHITYKMYITA